MSKLRGVIRVGDATNHGGKVISGSETTFFMGKAIARVGDLVSCPIKGHGVNPIIEGDPNFKDVGKEVALDGHHSQCGCTLISSLYNVGKA